MNECDDVRGWSFQTVREDRARVSLDDARRRLGTTMQVVPEFWWWTPGDVRWLLREWTRGLDAVRDGDNWSRQARHRPWPLTAPADGIVWLIFRSPAAFRGAVGFAALFMFMFMIGRY